VHSAAVSVGIIVSFQLFLFNFQWPSIVRSPIQITDPISIKAIKCEGLKFNGVILKALLKVL